MNHTANFESEILEAERQRCDCLMRGDVDRLAALLADDLVHIHGNGQIDDKACYLDGVARKYLFRAIERHNLRIRTYGDVAVMTGRLTQTIVEQETEQEQPIEAVTTQTWIRTDRGWLQNTCHNAFLPAPEPA
jgi:ketosteroid isomerase-like protein